MARSLDAGAFAQHYCSYETDDKARIGERKLINTLKDDEKFEDPQFKADGTSLYYDPLHPPVYGIPPDVVNWPRLSEVGSIKGLVEPVPINETNGGMVQGALRDRWFLSALGLLNTVDKVKRVLVSAECADKGIYTVKFFKSGRWRYVHVDDHPLRAERHAAFREIDRSFGNMGHGRREGLREAPWLLRSFSGWYFR